MSSLPRHPDVIRASILVAVTLVIAALFTGMIANHAHAVAAAMQIGRPAPDFTARDTKGTSLSLGQFRGKTVVLEWTNADCPYTRKHYTSGNMQSIQALAQKNGVVWLTVISSAPGKQGYVNGPAADALTQSRGAVPAAVLGVSGCNNPPRTDSNVLLPQPDGPTIATTSPALTVNDTSSSTASAPKRWVMWSAIRSIEGSVIPILL